MAWKSEPGNAYWYGEVIFENEKGETDYAYAYSAAQGEPDVEEILPASMRGNIIERKVQPTPRGRDVLGLTEDDYPLNEDD